MPVRSRDWVRTAEQSQAAAPTGDVSADEYQEPRELRAPGALRGMVEDHLREHPGEEFSPTAIGRALTRSAGAVHNAQEKLVENGYALHTSDKPKKYSLATDPAAAHTK
ncbi:hypothetical protein [Saccharothrix syringae]|uniref:hypothetical protein n=1 Tax=Saccharothrix syringae TaxID=103733 RepID=UPI0005275336|nr:hypothetical protein [Saccharothrix syringae]